MTKDEIKEHLCVNDKRSPNYIDFNDEEEPFEVCGSCDPCFSGKAKLANFTLELIDSKYR